MLKNFSLFLLSLLLPVLFFIGADFIYTRIKPVDLNGVSSLLESKDMGWYELKPNQRLIEQWGPDKSFLVTTDENGFRTANSDSKVGLGEFVFLGDSFTFGQNEWEDSFVGMFDRSIDAKVFNTGVPSYSPTAYLYTYKKILNKKILKPQHTVIIGLDISDVQDEAAYYINKDGKSHPIKRQEVDGVPHKPKYTYKEFYSFLSKHFRASSKIVKFIHDSSFFSPPQDVFLAPRSAFTWEDWRALNQRYGDEYKDGRLERMVGYLPLGVEGGLSAIEAKISEIIKLSSKEHSKVYILIYPWPAQIKFEQKFNWSEWVLGMCLRVGCTGIIDAQPLILEYRNNHSNWYHDLYTSGDIHFNKRGNELVYQAIKEQIGR